MLSKETYEEIEMSIIKFGSSDIITDSTETEDYPPNGKN